MNLLKLCQEDGSDEFLYFISAYNPTYGTARYQKLKSHAQHQKRRSNKVLFEYVVSRLKRYWSPEQIVGRLHLDFVDDLSMHVCIETIYRWVYQDVKAGGDLYTYLRRNHKKRKRQKRLGKKTSLIKDRISIHERPSIVALKTRFGDWEGDTVMGAQGKGAVVTLVERKSRFLLAGCLASKSPTQLTPKANSPGTRTEAFMKAVKVPVHIPLSGNVMTFDESGHCTEGCF